MTMENWYVIMWSGMRGVGPWSSIYFIIWIFFGNYVLMNLFLALLLEAFQADDSDENQEETESEDTEENITLKLTYLQKIKSSVA